MQNFESIYKQYVGDIFRYSMFKLKNKDEAEDVTSEAFLRAFKHKDIATIKNIKVWLISISRNIIFEKYRKDLAGKARKTDIDDSAIGEFASADLQVEDKVVQEELLEIIKSELDNLDEPTRETLILKIWEGLSFIEIADLLKEKESTIKLRFYRGLEKLKLKLSDNNLAGQARQKYVAIPLILAGINQIRKSLSYSPANGYLASLSKSLNLSSNQFIMKPLLLKSLAGLFIVTAVVGSLILIPRLATSDSSLVTSYVVSFPNKIESNVNCLTEYKNELYPDFSFEYDKCKWTLTEKQSQQNMDIIKAPPYPITKINLQSGNLIGNIDLKAVVTGYGRNTCTNEDYRKLNNSMALVKSRKNNNFEYVVVDNIYEKGTNEFNEIINSQEYTTLHESNPKYNLTNYYGQVNSDDGSVINKDTATICFTPSINKLVNSTIAAEPYKEIYNGYPGTFDFVLEVNIENSSFDAIEASGFNNIVKSIKLDSNNLSFTKECNSHVLNLYTKIPKDWECKIQSNLEGSAGKGSFETMTIDTGKFEIKATNLGVGYDCFPENGCTMVDFYKNNKSNARKLIPSSNNLIELILISGDHLPFGIKNKSSFQLNLNTQDEIELKKFIDTIEFNIYADWKTCGEAELNLSFKVPQDWECSVYKEREGPNNQYDQVIVTSESEFFEMKIGTHMFHPCDGGCREEDVNPFYNNSIVNVDLVGGTSNPIYGYGYLTKSLGTKLGISLSFSYKDKNITSLSAEREQEIKQIMDSIVYLP